MEALGGMYLLMVLFLIVLGICWLILPFALIGTKPILRDILVESRKTNELLQRMTPKSQP